MVYKLKVKDRNNLLGFMSENKDDFEEWYITINNKRLFLYEPKILNLYLNKIKHGEVIMGNYAGTGFIYTWGKSEKNQRIYLKLMASDDKSACQMLQNFLNRYRNKNLYTKVKKDNPLKALFMHYGFKFKGGRGKEVLLAREVYKND